MKKIALFLIFIFLISSVASVQDINGQTPTVFTDPATKISFKSATLNGHRDPNVNYTGTTIGPNYYFEYGTSFPDALTKTEIQPLKVDKANYTAVIKNLKKNKLYYYRLVEETGSTMSNEITKTPGDLMAFYISNKGKGEMVDMCVIKPKLKFGMTNNSQVYMLQKYLYEAKYLKVLPDGNFGVKTRAALKKFQKEVNLAETGIFDDPTSKQITLCAEVH